MADADRVHAAVSDSWEVEGRIRVRDGGGAARVSGARLMASGLPHSWWNAADVTDPSEVDLAAVDAFFAERNARFGTRVAAGTPWPRGRLVVHMRLMAMTAAAFVPAPPVPGLSIALSDDLETIVAVDAAAFQSDPAAMRAWLVPHMGRNGIETALARFHGEPVATAYTLRSDGDAGPSLLLGGVGVLRHARRKGIGAAVSSWLIERGFATGAELAHLRPDHEAAARVYARLGFSESRGLDVYDS